MVKNWGSSLHVPVGEKKIIQMSYIMTTRCGQLSRAGTKHGQRRQYGTRRTPSMKHYVFATRQLWGLNAIGGGNCATNKKMS